MKYETIIIGGGPAGLTAGIYASRAGLKSLLIEKAIFGGQIINAQKVENYPGFPDGISGFDLASLMQQQASKYDLEMVNDDVINIKPGKPHQVITQENVYDSDSVIIAAGAQYNRLEVDGETQYVGKGVSYCATCDAYMFRERVVAVIGGGDTALADALELVNHASTVYLIHRRDELRASKVLQERVLRHKKMKFLWNTVVEKISGDKFVTTLILKNIKSGESLSLPVSGIFVAIGQTPNSVAFAGTVHIDKTGEIITNELMTTSIPGIFAAGDIRKNSARQVSTAVGDGATAALSAFKYVREEL